MKNRIAAILLVVSVLGAVWLVGSRVGGKSTAASLVTAPAGAQPLPSNTSVPKHIAYGLFFGEMMALKKKAVERQKQGMKNEAMRDFHKLRLKVSDHEGQVLEQVASECNDKVVKINDQARVIINKERARHPHGRLKEGEPLPVPPPELLQLEDQRTQTLLDARDQLRNLLGQKAFDRIDTAIQNDIEARSQGSSRRRQ